jgi:hypothetical protein
VFRFEAKQAKKQNFFALKRKLFRFIFASFRFEPKTNGAPYIGVNETAEADTAVSLKPLLPPQWFAKMTPLCPGT